MIEISGLQKVIDQRTVLDIDRLVVRDGEIVGIIGPPGSGKSVLFEILVGQLAPSAGEVKIDGLDPQNRWDELAGQVGVVFESDQLYSRMNVERNLTFVSQLHGVEKGAVGPILEQVGLADQMHKKIEDLGESLQRRLAFARAILHQPSTLILAEPFARCDQKTIRILSDLLVDLAEAGTAIFVLAEDPQHLEALFDRSLKLIDGTLSERLKEPDAQHQDHPFKIPVKEEGRVALLNTGDVLFAEVEDGRAILMTTQGERLQTQFNLTELEERLRLKGFFRAHRGYLVNLQHVTEVIPFTRNSYSLRLDDDSGTLIPLSKSAAATLKEILDY